MSVNGMYKRGYDCRFSGEVQSGGEGYEYYEENVDEECYYRNEYKGTSHNIYPYANGAGEVEFYRLKLTLNRIGQAFLEIDHF